MKRTILMLSIVALIAATQGCGCCGLFRRSHTVAMPTPVCDTAPACCPSAPCGGCDSCATGGVPTYGAPGLTYPAPSLPADAYQYGNATLPPGP